MSSSLRPHGLQHTRVPYPSPTPGACSNSCPLSWWCHPTISSCEISCFQSFPASGSFVCLFVCFCFPWRLITLQYCSGFAIQGHESAMGIHVCPILNPPSHLPPHPIPLGRPSAPALSTLSHALNLEWWSVSHMIMYVFPCYFLKSSHPRFLPQSLKDFYTRVIVTISKFCIYALVYCIGVYLSGLLTLHNGPQFHWPR